MRINPFEVVFCDRIRLFHPSRLYDRLARDDFESCGIIVRDPYRGVSIEFSPARVLGRANILPVTNQELRIALDSILESLSNHLPTEGWKVSSVDLALNREVDDPSNYLFGLSRVGYFHDRQSLARVNGRSVQGRFPTLYWETSETMARVYSKAEESKNRLHLLSGFERSSLTKMVRLELRLHGKTLSREMSFRNDVPGFIRFMSRSATAVFSKRMKGLLRSDLSSTTGAVALFDEVVRRVGRNNLSQRTFIYMILASESSPEIAAMKLKLSPKQLRAVRRLVNACNITNHRK